MPRVTSERKTLMTGIAAGLLVVMAVGLMIRLAALDRGGPPHDQAFLPNNIPATLYVPGEDGDDFPFQKPKGERPPLVIIAHGYSFDRNIMSAMARSLAKAGFAALTFDFRGHGDNTEEFRGELTDDLDAVVDWAQQSPHVDGERIAVLGHSMGAHAALEFATIDPRPLAVIPVSGGWEVRDAVMPKNVLLLVAENDPGRIHDDQEDVAALLEGKTNIRSVEIEATDHGTILWSGDTVDEIVSFLNPIFGTDATSPGVDDPRLRTAVAYLVVVMILLGFLGRLVGGFAPASPASVNWGGLVLLIAALVVTMPLFASGGPTFLPLGAGQAVVMSSAVTGGLLWATRALALRGTITGRLATWAGVRGEEGANWSWPSRSALAPGVGAAVAMFLLLLPVSIVFHRLVPTTERLVYWVILAAFALPFFAAFEAIVRRGNTWQAIGLGLVGRVILLALMLVGVGVGILPPVLALVLPLLLLQYVAIEIFAATCYAVGRNPAVVAVMESVIVGWIAVTITPVS